MEKSAIQVFLKITTCKETSVSEKTRVSAKMCVSEKTPKNTCLVIETCAFFLWAPRACFVREFRKAEFLQFFWKENLKDIHF